GERADRRPAPGALLAAAAKLLPGANAARADGDAIADAACRRSSRGAITRSDTARVQPSDPSPTERRHALRRTPGCGVVDAFRPARIVAGRPRNLRRAVVCGDRAHARDGHPPGARRPPP